MWDRKLNDSQQSFVQFLFYHFQKLLLINFSGGQLEILNMLQQNSRFNNTGIVL